MKKAIADTGIKATMATTNLFYHPVFKDGAFTSTDPAIRLFATQKVMRCLDIAADLGGNPDNLRKKLARALDRAANRLAGEPPPETDTP